MTREKWLPQLMPFLQPAPDPELAAAGVLQPKPEFWLTFSLFGVSASTFPDAGFVNLTDETVLIIVALEYGHEVVHKVCWENILSVSIQFTASYPEGDDPARTEARLLAKQMIMRRL
jgi:hypothetical protein